MSTIHGSSWEAIAAFREKPAALAVYWIYCARVNRDNVAWPSLRGLAKNTGWSVSACQEARKWLVAHGALEQVAGYTRPQWRTAPEKRRTELQNLDRAEYYRPTGYIEFTGRFDLLYIPGKDAAPAVEDDVLPGTTSDASEQRPGNTELDSTNTELDSTLAPDGAPDGVQEKPTKTRQAKPRDLLFEAICEHIVGVPYEKAPNGDKNYARAIYSAIRARVPDGEPMPTPEDAAAFKANYLAANPTLSLPGQAHKIADWLLKLRAAQTQPTAPAPDGITAEDLARTLEQMNAQEARYYDQPA